MLSTEHGALVAGDCSDPAAPLTPIGVVRWADGVLGDVHAESVGEMVSLWLEGIESGCWRYEEVGGRGGRIRSFRGVVAGVKWSAVLLRRRCVR